jgi:hypothetical protein
MRPKVARSVTVEVERLLRMSTRKYADERSLRSSSRHRWIQTAKAACVYALTVFAIGFVLGAARVLVAVPHVGQTAAVLLESPLMLAASWKLSRWCATRYGLSHDREGARRMGAIALFVLLIAELATAVLCLHINLSQYVAGVLTMPGVIGLAGQICFACFPFLQAASYRGSGQSESADRS